MPQWDGTRPDYEMAVSALMLPHPLEAVVEESKSRLGHPVGADLGDSSAQLES